MNFGEMVIKKKAHSERHALRRLYEMTQDGQFCEKIRDGRAAAISEPGPCEI